MPEGGTAFRPGNTPGSCPHPMPHCPERKDAFMALLRAALLDLKRDELDRCFAAPSPPAGVGFLALVRTRIQPLAKPSRHYAKCLYGHLYGICAHMS